MASWRSVLSAIDRQRGYLMLEVGAAKDANRRCNTRGVCLTLVCGKSDAQQSTTKTQSCMVDTALLHTQIRTVRKCHWIHRSIEPFSLDDDLNLPGIQYQLSRWTSAIRDCVQRRIPRRAWKHHRAMTERCGSHRQTKVHCCWTLTGLLRTDYNTDLATTSKIMLSTASGAAYSRGKHEQFGAWTRPISMPYETAPTLMNTLLHVLCCCYHKFLAAYPRHTSSELLQALSIVCSMRVVSGNRPMYYAFGRTNVSVRGMTRSRGGSIVRQFSPTEAASNVMRLGLLLDGTMTCCGTVVVTVYNMSKFRPAASPFQ